MKLAIENFQNDMQALHLEMLQGAKPQAPVKKIYSGHMLLIDAPASNILPEALCKISNGDYNSLTDQQSKGEYLEETTNGRAICFKDNLFPKFMRKRESFPTDYDKEYLLFIDGKIQGIRWEWDDGSHHVYYLNKA